MRFQRVILFSLIFLFAVSCAEDEGQGGDLNKVYNTKEDQSVIIVPLQGNDRLNREIYTIDPPQNGSLKNQGDGSYLYVPKPNFFGQESIPFLLKDGDVGKIEINIQAVNDPPIVQDDFFSADQTNPVETLSIPVLENDMDVEGAGLSIVSVEQPPVEVGTVSVNGDNVEFTPTLSFAGPLRLSYSVSDGNLVSQGNVNIFVIPSDSSIVSLNILRGTASPTEILLQEGEVARLRAVATLSGGAQVDVSNRVQWTTLNQAVAQVNNGANKGRIAGQSAGTTQVLVAANGIQPVGKTVRVLAPPPPAPRDINATLNRAEKKVVVNWPVVDDAGYYNLYVVSGGKRVVFSGVNPPYDHVEILNGSSYSYVVHSVRDGVEGPASKEISLTVFIDRPNPPEYINATSVNNQIDLTWSSVQGAESYNIYWSTSLPVPLGVDNSFVSTTTSYSHSPVTAGTTYHYIITTNREGQESLPSIVHTALVRPNPVSNLAAAGNHRVISLSWGAAATADYYYVYYSESQPVAKTPNNRFLVNDIQYLHESLNNGDEWFYSVTAVNSGGESDSVEINETVGLHIEDVFTDTRLDQCIISEGAARNWTYAHDVRTTFVCTNQPITNLNGLHYLENAPSFNFSGAQLSDLSYFTQWAFPNLNKLTLQNNQIQTTAALSGLTGLSEIDLSTNALSDNLAGLAGLTNLTWVRANNAGLTSLSVFETTPALNFLSVDSNNLTSLSGLSGLQLLRNLSFSRNQITDLQALSNLNLQNLKFRDNYIVDISPLATVFNGQTDAVLLMNDNYVSTLLPLNGAPLGTLWAGDNWIMPYTHTVANGERYEYFVTSVDSNGIESPRSNVAIAIASTAKASVIPRKPIARINENGFQELRWVPVPGIPQYKVYWGTNPNLDISNPATSSLLVTPPANRISSPAFVQGSSLANGTYYYVVTAVDDAQQESLPSKEVVFVQEDPVAPVNGRPAAPTNLTATSLDGAIALLWNPVPGAASYNLYFVGPSAGVTLLSKVDAENVPNTSPNVQDIGNAFTNVNLPSLQELRMGNDFSLQRLVKVDFVTNYPNLSLLSLWANGVSNIQPLLGLNSLSTLFLTFNPEILCADITNYNTAKPEVSMVLDTQPANNINGVDDPIIPGTNCTQ